MRPDAHDPGSLTVLAELPILEEHVDASPWPPVASSGVAEPPEASHGASQLVSQHVELVEVPSSCRFIHGMP